MEAGPAAAVLVGSVIAGLPLGIVSRVQSGYQEGFAAGLWGAVGAIVGLGMLFGAISLRLGLPWLIAGTVGGPLVAAAANGVVLFGQRPWLRPAWSAVDLAMARRLMRTGGLFLALQVTSALAFTSDSIVIAHVVSARAVAEYAVGARLFSVPLMIASMAWTPLWPAYAEAIARGDLSWVRRNLTRSIAISAAFGVVACGVLVLSGRAIIGWWIGNAVAPSHGLLVALGAWTAIYIAMVPIAMFLNGANIIGFQVILAVVLAVLALVAKIMLGERFGTSGVVCGTVVMYVLVVGLPYGIVVPRIVRRLSSRPQEKYASIG